MNPEADYWIDKYPDKKIWVDTQETLWIEEAGHGWFGIGVGETCFLCDEEILIDQSGFRSFSYSKNFEWVHNDCDDDDWSYIYAYNKASQECGELED